MRRWVMAGMVVIVGLMGIGLLLVSVQRQRLKADRLQCLFRFEQLGQFATLYSQGTAALKPGERLDPNIPLAIPPGTVPNLVLPPDRRLSWVCDILPFLDQKTQATADLHGRFDRTAAWDAGSNRDLATTPLKLFLCPGAVPDVPAEQPAVTQFVGLAGLGRNAATLTLTPPLPTRAGCFRYDAPTPLALVREHDGLGTTFLFAETADELGPWVRGGFSTVRGLDDATGAKPPLGRGGQFGGNYPAVVGFGRADGSAEFYRVTMSDAVLKAMFTIAGGEGDGVPGGD
ncbi:MAG: DUF1559 domain-containing protein [Fimbriiglobus sp.]|jgi:hypothetical protein|nr:DUF1559 domain-containing protein [Fimbriiglobus sp.]